MKKPIAIQRTSAATESSESALWAGAAVSTVGFGILKAPNPKLQIANKLQAPSSKTTPPLMLDKGSAVAGRPSWPGRLWDLKLGACLELGAWRFGVPSDSIRHRGLATPRESNRAASRRLRASIGLTEKCLTLSGSPQHHENKQNDEHQAKPTAGIIPPALTVRPGWQRPEEQEKQYNY